jgi:hypothetical protein
VSYLRGFVPWIVFAVVASFDWRWAALAALLTGLFLLTQDRRAGVEADAQILDVSTVVYFVAIGTLAFASPDSALEPYNDVISFGWLALTAWGTLVIRRPFTLGIAKRQTPREYWGLPEFVQINVVITTVWATGFTLIGASLAVCTVTGAPAWVGIACHVAGLAAPAVFTSLYPGRVQARLAATAV